MGYVRIVLLGLALTLMSGAQAQEIKKCEFCGSFYPDDPAALGIMLDTYLAAARVQTPPGEIIGVVVPHAGFTYSGPVAAHSYKLLDKNSEIDAVVLLGATHRYPFSGITIYPRGGFQTPLGTLLVNANIAGQFQSLNFVSFQPQYFTHEHTLEVQLPFIIKALGNPTIVPILFGTITDKQIESFAQRLAEIASQKKLLLVVSSDLSHYLPYLDAHATDAKTLQFLRDMNETALRKEDYRACGNAALAAFIQYARIRKANIAIIHYANSGDTAGDKNRVVGYASAVAFLPGNATTLSAQNTGPKPEEEVMQPYTITPDEKKILLRIARSTLQTYLKNKTIPNVAPLSDNLSQKRGAFVTLTKNGKLRGCIGRIVGDTALYTVVSQMAIEAATGDPRFAPVRFDELNDIHIEISVLTPFEKISSLDEIEVGKHGLIIKKGFSSGLLLPQVPGEYGWDKITFLEQTCLKAGLPPDAYKDGDAILYKFSAIVFNEIAQ
ncbi:MAG: AmmeMemoRadiSam system protein B [Candidatus Omnitrophota bacterium]|nr:AmmeMemoRadiSam system protein B [Candidatus Omnitrophota bacterium]